MKKVMKLLINSNATFLGMAVFAVAASMFFISFASVVGETTTLNVQCSASPVSAETNQNVSFISAVSGGTGSYTYSWTDACSGSSANCVKSFSTPGTYTARLTVASGGQARSANCPVLITGTTPPPPPPPATLNVQCAASPTLVDENQAVTFMSTVSGGTGSYNYSWTDACNGTSSTCIKSFSNAGIYTARLTVASGSQTKSANCPVQVTGVTPPPPPANLNVQCAASPTLADVGESVTFMSTVSGGTGSYNYAWTDGCSGSASNCSKSFSTPGIYTAKLTVTSGSQTRIANCPVQIKEVAVPDLNAQCAASPTVADVGENVNFRSTVSGGTGSYTYSWTGACTGFSADCARTFNNAGIQTAKLTVTSGNQTRIANCPVQIKENINPLDVECTTDPSTVYVGEPVRYISEISGGSGSYGYSWSGACSGSSANCTKVFSNLGSKTATVTVTSNGQTKTATCSASVIDETCTPHAFQRCYGGQLYWYNSCGEREEHIPCSGSCVNDTCVINNYIGVQTNPASGLGNGQAVLNGYLSTNNSYTSCNNYVWFQYGNSVSYLYETPTMPKPVSGPFSQVINTNLNQNISRFRAAARDCLGNVVYGQDMPLQSNVGGGNIVINKTVRNLTKGTNWAKSTYANPTDTLMFMVTLQVVGNSDLQNISVRDILPQNLLYKNQMIVSWSNNTPNNYYAGDITTSLNFPRISAGQTIAITYQTQVAGQEAFGYGSTNLTNNVSVTGMQLSHNPSSNASVIVTKGAVYGASTVPTGLTNNFWVDSFLLPLIITLLLIWLMKSGMFFGLEKWFAKRKTIRRDFHAEKELSARIEMIRRAEGTL